MIYGPRVDVYVGATKKYHTLPKLLLCHYSDYFQRCCSSKFIEGKAQTLNLPEDDERDFSILLEYMLHGAIPDSLKVTEKTYDGQLARCIAFLEYADKYNLGPVGDVVCDALKWASNYSTSAEIQTSHIELVFRISPLDSLLRTTIVQCALSSHGTTACLAFFQKQMEEIPGFAVQLLKEIVSSRVSKEWKDHLRDRKRVD